MKKLLILSLLSLGLTSFKADDKLAPYAKKRITGIWVNADKSDPVKLFKFFPTGLINIAHADQNTISKYRVDKDTLSSITGTIDMHPTVAFTATFNSNQDMQLVINYQGVEKQLHLIKTADIKSGVVLLNK